MESFFFEGELLHLVQLRAPPLEKLDTVVPGGRSFRCNCLVLLEIGVLFLFDLVTNFVNEVLGHP